MLLVKLLQGDNMNNDASRADIIKEYKEFWDDMRQLIDQTQKKAQKAMRITLWLKVIVAFASIYSIGSWLRKHGSGEVWALILIFAEVADMLFDTLPYFQQRVELPKMKLKLEHVEIELKRDMFKFERGEIDEEEALRRYFSHRKAWLKVAG